MDGPTDDRKYLAGSPAGAVVSAALAVIVGLAGVILIGQGESTEDVTLWALVGLGGGVLIAALFIRSRRKGRHFRRAGLATYLLLFGASTLLLRTFPLAAIAVLSACTSVLALYSLSMGFGANPPTRRGTS
jgi:hypothetical protein